MPRIGPWVTKIRSLPLDDIPGKTCYDPVVMIWSLRV